MVRTLLTTGSVAETIGSSRFRRTETPSLIARNSSAKYGAAIVDPMPSDIDIYRSAKLLIDQHGEDAAIFAAQQADRCLEAGDLDGKAVWMRVIGAIKELQDRRPPAARQPLH